MLKQFQNTRWTILIYSSSAHRAKRAGRCCSTKYHIKIHLYTQGGLTHIEIKIHTLNGAPSPSARRCWSTEIPPHVANAEKHASETIFPSIDIEWYWKHRCSADVDQKLNYCIITKSEDELEYNTQENSQNKVWNAKEMAVCSQWEKQASNPSSVCMVCKVLVWSIVSARGSHRSGIMLIMLRASTNNIVHASIAVPTLHFSASSLVRRLVPQATKVKEHDICACVIPTA